MINSIIMLLNLTWLTSWASLFFIFQQRLSNFHQLVVTISDLEVYSFHLLPANLLSYERNFFSYEDEKQPVLEHILSLSKAWRDSCWCVNWIALSAFLRWLGVHRFWHQCCGFRLLVITGQGLDYVYALVWPSLLTLPASLLPRSFLSNLHLWWSILLVLQSFLTV